MALWTAGCQGFIEGQVFFPQKRLEASPADLGLGYEDIWFKAADGTALHGWLVPAAGAGPLLVFCHGNAGNISHRVENLRLLHDLGLAVFIFDYRGYGNSQGRPSERGFYLDAEAAQDQALALAERGRSPLIIFGRSLGGVAAVHMAARRAPAGLVLESTFGNLGEIGAAHFPLPLLRASLRGHFNAAGEIGRVSAPLLFLHGDADDIVPLKLGRALYEAAPGPKRFVTLAGAGHNDTYLRDGPLYWRVWREFLDGLDLSAPGRP